MTETKNAVLSDKNTASNSTKNSIARFRVFASIGYPDSLADGWKDTLAETHVPVLISPLHDRDLNPDGTKKKPHHHIMLMFDGKKTVQQAKAIFESIGAVGCEAVNSTRGQARYLCHLDNPDKELYSVKDVIALNGADYSTIIALPSDRYGAIREMLAFIEHNDVLSFYELLQWASDNNEEWFRALCDSSAYIIREALESRRWSIEHVRDFGHHHFEMPRTRDENGPSGVYYGPDGEEDRADEIA